MSAVIIINQATLGAGVTGRSRSDGVASQLVTCTNSTVQGSYLWTLVDVPIRSALTRGTTGAAASFTFTPDVKGTYTVSLRVNGSSAGADNTSAYLAIRSSGGQTLGWRYQGAGETTEDNEIYAGLGFPSNINIRGWATNEDVVFEAIEQGIWKVQNGISTFIGVATRLVYTDPATGKIHSSLVAGSTPSGSAGGDLGGTYPNPTVTGLQGRAVSATPPAINNVLAWNGAAWAAAVLPISTGTTSFFDDLGATPNGGGWLPKLSNNGTALWMDSAASYGFPSSGVILLRVSIDAGSKSLIGKAAVGAVLGASAPIVFEWRASKSFTDAPVLADNECQYAIGMAAIDNSGNIVDGVLVYAIWSGGVRTWALATVKATVITSDVFAMPAGTYFNARITMTETQSTLELSVNDGAFSTVRVSTVAPTQATYAPFAFISKDTGAGARAILLDFIDGHSTRTSVDTTTAAVTGTFPTAVTAVTGSGGVASSGGTTPNVTLTYGSGANTVTQGNDSRLSDARTPTAHATSHKIAGSDAIKLNELAAPTAVVDFSNQKITSLANGSAASDGAAFGQIATAIAAILPLPNPLLYAFMKEDYTGPVLASSISPTELMYIATVAGVAAAATWSAGLQGIPAHPGIVVLTTGTDTTGSAGLFTMFSMNNSSRGLPKAGAGVMHFRHIFNLIQLSTVAQEFKLRIGTGDSLTAPTIGVHVVYDRLTSVNWIVKSPVGTVSTTSSVAVAIGWHMLEIIVNAAGTAAEAFMDGVSLGIVTDALSGTWFQSFISIVKSAGTTAAIVYTDYVDYYEVFTAARNTGT